MLKKLLIAIVAVLGISLVGVVGTKAITTISEENSYFGADQVTDGSLYLGGSAVTMAGTVNGDLYCAGQTVEITGTVNGDVICAGQQIRVAGTVNGDIRVAGQIVDLDGKATGSLTAFAQTLRSGADASIGGDATIYGQTTMLNGSIGRDLLGGGQIITISNKVGRDVQVAAQNITLSPRANIGGSFTYTSKNNADVQQGAAVAGQTVHQTPKQETVATTEWSLASRAYFAGFWFLAMLLVGLVFLWVRPSVLDSTANVVAKQPWMAVGWGLVGVFATPLVAILVFITVIGIPLALIALLAWLLVLSVSVVFSTHAVGQLIIKQGSTKLQGNKLRFVSLALGLFLLAVASLLPIISTIAGLLAVTFGAGSLLSLLRNKSVTNAKLAAKRS